ncbi:MAG: hypothetical protein AAFO02_23760, partial [Bacteroidota bacterium]
MIILLFNIRQGSGPTKCTLCQREKTGAIEEQVGKRERCGTRNCAFDNDIGLAILERIAPRINDFIADRDFIEEGQLIRLSWQTERANQLELSPQVGDVTGQYFVEFVPEAAGKIQLRAVNEHGEVTSEVELKVAEPQIHSFTIDKDIIPLGGEVRLSWSADTYRTLRINSVIDVTGQNEATITVDREYRHVILTALGHFGVRQHKSRPVQIAKIESFTAERLPDGKHFELSWLTQNFRDIEISDPTLGTLFEGRTPDGKMKLPVVHQDIELQLTGT